LLKSWLFSNHFMEQPHLPKITNIKWITLVGLQGLAWCQLFCCRSIGGWGHRRSRLCRKSVAKASGCWAWQMSSLMFSLDLCLVIWLVHYENR
jgi:hypothetical protein